MYGGHYFVNSALSSPSAHTAEIDLASPSDQRLSWIVGAFYLHQINNVATIQYENTAPGPMPVNYNPSPAQLTAMYADGLYNGFENESQLKHTANAIYGQGVYHITPALTLTAGARYTWDYSTGAVSSYYSAFAHIHTSFEKLTGKVSLDYALTDDNMVYATASKGVKPGGTNLTYFQLVKPTYLPESVDEIEVGSKNEFFDNNLRINGDVFYNDYQNMQMDSDDLLPYDGGMTNVGLVHTYGVELDATAILPYNFRLEGNIASMGGRVNSHTTLLDPVMTTAVDQRYGPFSPQDLAGRAAVEEDVYGHTPGKLPNFSTTIALSREDTLPFGGNLESSIRGIYRAGYFFRVFDNPISDKIPSLYRLDASFKYTPEGANFYGEFLVTNLTNDADINARVAENFGLGVVSNIYVPPRQFVLRIGYNM
jgi:iron complex outermembrane receptor protein